MHFCYLCKTLLNSKVFSVLLCALSISLLCAQEKHPKTLSTPVKEPRNLAALQESFLKLKFGMFIHFNMGTFAKREWATGFEDPSIFNPKHLDCNQWAEAAASANMKYAILTVKHTGGWCLWDSKYTDHDIRQFKNYRGGKGDLVREFVEAFRKRGIKVGFYYCFPLLSRSWRKYWTLPIKGYQEGKCDALGFIKGQFKELLTKYGKISVLWVDQAASKHGGLKAGDWQKIKQYVHRIAPECIVIGNNLKDYSVTDIYSYEYPYVRRLPPEGNKNPSEVSDKLQRHWFSCQKGEAVPVKSVGYVTKMLRYLVRNRSNYLLNCAPDDTGLICTAAFKRLREIGKAWKP